MTRPSGFSSSAPATTWGSRPAPTSRRSSTTRPRSRACSSSPTSTTRSSRFPKPTIAACHGDVVGGGAEIAIACDMRVGGSNLRMRFPGAALGVPVGPARLVTLCGLATAKYLLLSSRTIGADEALRLGLVNRVAPAAATEDAARELAAEVAANPPEAVARLKRMLHDVGRRRGALTGRGRRPGRVAAVGAGPARRVSGLDRLGPVPDRRRHRTDRRDRQAVHVGSAAGARGRSG